MTSFLIGYPDIPESSEITTSEAFDLDFPHYNLITGYKFQHAFLQTASGTTKTITFDLGASTTRSAEYVYLARADLLQDALCTTFKLQRSTDGSAWTDVVSQASFGSETLYGAKLDDWFSTFAATTAYRYWRLSYEVSGSSKIAHSKAYFGSWLDLGREPSDFTIKRSPQSKGRFVAGSGAVHYNRMSEDAYDISLEWDVIADAEAVEFEKRIIDRKHIDTFLFYTDSVHNILDNHRVMLGKVKNASRVQDRHMPNCNRLSLEFEELIG